MTLRRLVGYLVLTIAVTLLPVPVFAEATSGTTPISSSSRSELLLLNYARNVITVDIYRILDSAESMINSQYSYAIAIRDRDAESAGVWKDLLKSQYNNMVTIRNEMNPKNLQLAVDGSESFASSIIANNLLHPTAFVQGIDVLLSGLAQSVSVLENSNAKDLAYLQSVFNYFLVLKDNVTRYNIIAGEITAAILLDFPLPHVITFQRRSDSLPLLEVPTATPPTELATAISGLGGMPNPPPSTPLTHVGQTPTVIESHIEGDFEGWDGDTIFVLANGQIWQQDSYAYHYSFAYRPRVIIYQSTHGGYKMRVDGVNEEIEVKRVK